VTSDELPVEMLRKLRRVSVEADALIEECIRDRLPLRAILERFLPKLETWIGAHGALVTTRNEHLAEDSFGWGAWNVLGGAELEHEEGQPVALGTSTLLWTRLTLGGLEVGRVAVIVDGDRTQPEQATELREVIATVFAELDVVLETVHAAAHKQRLIVELEELLADPVFERGVDRAVALLHREIHARTFVLVYRDDVERGRLRYRLYEAGTLVHANDGSAGVHAELEATIARHGVRLLEPGVELGVVTGGVETLLATGITDAHWLGKVVCAASAHGFSTFALDVVQVMSAAMSQRLVDFNRERRHLAQFFAPAVITELLRDADYHDRHLSPREETIAVLFADINSFTKISEQVLERPGAIAEFVHRWSAGAVELLWRHAGVFDKMVGDCVIGLFGPPFFREQPAAYARAALEAARAIAAFTISLEHEAPYDRIPRSGIVPGLGVAIGLNVCPMAVGLMGPNQDYTGFSSGMNNTARLQTLAGFRETLAMASFCELVEGARGVIFSPEMEAPVKNVKLPLRYRRLTFETR
jgi:class 3 adenylate cyclase